MKDLDSLEECKKMIEIKCTQKEKENILCALANPDNYCFVPTDCVRGKSCEECLNEHIKWVITDGGV